MVTLLNCYTIISQTINKNNSYYHITSTMGALPRLT
jgi:hypothetical protein